MKSIISALIICCYILCCLRLRTAPWKYFQINARLFSREKGIFSKISIDGLIPEKWKLSQQLLTNTSDPVSYPVFVKPEWGQNAIGIERADDKQQFLSIRKRLCQAETSFVVQEAATESREFEIFTTFDDREHVEPDLITVTEAVNKTHRFPINSINNSDTEYLDITDQFSDAELRELGRYTGEIGRFGQSRLSVRANSLQGLIDGNFHVIELNLFTPMPINLLDKRYTLKRTLAFILRVSRSLARVTRAIDRNQPSHPVFTRMVLYGRKRKTPLDAVLRSFL